MMWKSLAAEATQAAITSAAPEEGGALGGNSLAAFSASPLHSRSVKTIIVTDGFGFSLEKHMEELCSSVKEWGVDGLLFHVPLLLDSELYVHILEFIASIPSCTTLFVAVYEDGFEALCRAISCSPNLTHLYLDVNCVHLALRKSHLAQLLGKALLLSGTKSLQSLSIHTTLCSKTSLIPLLTSSPSSLKSLSMHGFLMDEYGFFKVLDKIILIITWNYITLRSLSLRMLFYPVIPMLTWRSIGDMLLSNTSLTSFTLESAWLSHAAVRYLFTSLEKNHHLTSLSLRGCSNTDGLTNWPNALVLDTLRVNTTLHEVDLTDTPLQNDDAIRAQLFRNKVNGERVKVLRARNERLVRPTTIRLFFCGLQYSGKTTLSRSLANWNKKSSCFSHARSIVRLQRTRGIEVTILEKDQHLRISLWDMAGQVEFHSFHDSMFPDLSSHSTPSMFLFVLNPFQIDESGNIQLDSQGQKIKKGVHKFREEFKYWLRFIASKTLKSENFKPKVLVAVTRADLGFEDVRLWLEQDLIALQEEFQEVIQFDEKGIFHLNAKDYLQVGQLGSHVFDCAEAILTQLPYVYQACAEARELFSNKVRKNKVPSLITKSQFHKLCHEELDMDSQEMREAVALSLNDSGDIIYFKSLELVVLNTKWFCHEIMGDLLIDIMTKEYEVFFPLSAFQALLESIVDSRAVGKSILMNKIVPCSILSALLVRRTSMKVAGADLVKLLVGLRLACLEDIGQNVPRIFFSLSPSGKAKRTIFPSNFLKRDAGDSVTTYLGRRLTCKDSKRTFLTLGFFPLLQVTFHKTLHDRQVSVPVKLEEDVMAFGFDGVRVFVEFCRLEGNDHFIDILVYSPKSLDETIEWLQRNVILDVKKVCAESRGNQGVELASSIIQRACIEIFLDAESRLAVPVEELKYVLKYHLEEGVELMDDGIKKVKYTWQTHGLPSSSVVDLLGEVETTKVVQTYGRVLSEAEREISNLFIEEATTSERKEPFQFRKNQSSKEIEAVYTKLREFEENVMRGLQKLRHDVQDLRNAVLPKLDKLFTFVKDGEVGKLPRMFVITTDNGIVRRVVSAMVPGLQNVRLELLCECHRGPCHRVAGKKGLSVATLDDGLLKRGLPYINALVKVAYVVARVGAHVAVGFGDSIPDFTRVLANIVDAPNSDAVLAFNTDLTDDSSSRVDFQQGQQWLFDVLSNHNCIKGDKIYAKFGLRRVRLHDSRAAWVCDEHYAQGEPWPA